MKKCTVCGEMFDESGVYCPCGKCGECHGKLFNGAFGKGEQPSAEFTYNLLLSSPALTVGAYSHKPITEFIAFLIGLITDYKDETGKDGEELMIAVMDEIKRNALNTLQYAYEMKNMMEKADKNGDDIDQVAKDFINSIKWD